MTLQVSAMTLQASAGTPQLAALISDSHRAGCNLAELRRDARSGLSLTAKEERSAHSYTGSLVQQYCVVAMSRQQTEGSQREALVVTEKS